MINNNASDQPYPQGRDSSTRPRIICSEIWNHPAVLMQWPIHPKLYNGTCLQPYISTDVKPTLWYASADLQRKDAYA